MNIVLIGYRGSGKTTIGKKLASELWKTFIDTDVQTCKRLGDRTIAEIWQTDGEPVWRRAECEVTAEYLREPGHVLALGGGTVMQDAVRSALEQAVAAGQAVIIYLRCEPETLLKRIEGDGQSRATRPNLTSHGGGLEEIRAMIQKREPTYLALANHVLDVTRLTPDDAVRHLIRKFL